MNNTGKKCFFSLKLRVFFFRRVFFFHVFFSLNPLWGLSYSKATYSFITHLSHVGGITDKLEQLNWLVGVLGMEGLT